MQAKHNLYTGVKLKTCSRHSAMRHDGVKIISAALSYEGPMVLEFNNPFMIVLSACFCSFADHPKA